MVAPIEKAIRSSDLGLNPATSGMLIRVPLPPLTEERRRELTKVVRHLGEEAKVAVRNLRRDANEQIKKLTKAKEISEDDESRAEKEIQKLTDNFVVAIDKCVAEKDKLIKKAAGLRVTSPLLWMETAAGLSAVSCPVQKVTGVVCEVYAALLKPPPKAGCGISPFLLSVAKIGNVLPTKSML